MMLLAYLDTNIMVKQHAREMLMAAEECSLREASTYATSTTETAEAISSAAIEKCRPAWEEAGKADAADNLSTEHDPTKVTRMLIEREREKIIVRVFDARAGRQ